jgi:ABC-2 type transport system permease protein
MRKFFAVFKREYLKLVKSWSFLLGTLLVPFIGALFAIIPALLFSLNSGSVRLVIVDQSGIISARVKDNLSTVKLAEKAKVAAEESLRKIGQDQTGQLKNSASQTGSNFVFEDFRTENKPIAEIRNELNERIKLDKLDAYLIIPQDIDSKDLKVEFFSRNTSDFISKSMLEDSVNEAFRNERLAKSNIDEAKLQEINRKANFVMTKVSEKGEERDSGTGYFAAFGVAFLMYLVLTIYGQAIMAAVVEEKETRIAEVLFSSAKPFQLLMGKLVGVGMAGLTQVSVWLISASLLIAYGLATLNSSNVGEDIIQIPSISPLFVVYFVLFFILGFFTFAAIFALIGSIVPTLQEAGQFALIPVLLMLGGFYAMMPITRDPNSTLSVILSILPFASPMTMPTRIIIETPPFWQISLSILLNLITIAFLVWIASRVYRVGMLMYGKRATIPEIWKWVWQA